MSSCGGAHKDVKEPKGVVDVDTLVEVIRSSERFGPRAWHALGGRCCHFGERLSCVCASCGEHVCHWCSVPCFLQGPPELMNFKFCRACFSALPAFVHVVFCMLDSLRGDGEDKPILSQAILGEGSSANWNKLGPTGRTICQITSCGATIRSSNYFPSNWSRCVTCRWCGRECCNTCCPVRRLPWRPWVTEHVCIVCWTQKSGGRGDGAILWDRFMKLEENVQKLVPTCFVLVWQASDGYKLDLFESCEAADSAKRQLSLKSLPWVLFDKTFNVVASGCDAELLSKLTEYFWRTTNAQGTMRIQHLEKRQDTNDRLHSDHKQSLEDLTQEMERRHNEHKQCLEELRQEMITQLSSQDGLRKQMQDLSKSVQKLLAQGGTHRAYLDETSHVSPGQVSMTEHHLQRHVHMQVRDTMKAHESDMARSLNEYRAQGHEKQQEELTRFRDIINLNVNTSHKPLENKLNELLAEHAAMKKQSEQEAGAVSRDMRALRQDHKALEYEIEGRFHHNVERAVKRTVSDIVTELGDTQRQLHVDVSEIREEMAASHQAATLELQSVSERCEFRNEEHARTLCDALKTSNREMATKEDVSGLSRMLRSDLSELRFSLNESQSQSLGMRLEVRSLDEQSAKLRGEMREVATLEELRECRQLGSTMHEQLVSAEASSRSLQLDVIGLQDEVQRLHGENQDLSKFQKLSDMRTEVTADREELVEVRRGLREQEKLVQKVLTNYDVRAEVKSHQAELTEVRRGLKEHEKLMQRLFANETTSVTRTGKTTSLANSTASGASAVASGSLRSQRVVMDVCSAGGFPHHTDKSRAHVTDDAGALTTQTGAEAPGPPVRDQDTHVSLVQGTVAATAAQAARIIPARPTTLATPASPTTSATAASPTTAATATTATAASTTAATAATAPTAPTAQAAPTAPKATSQQQQQQHQQRQQRQQPPEAEMTPTTIPTKTPTPPLTSAPPLELSAVPPTPEVARGQATERASSAPQVELPAPVLEPVHNGGLFRSEYPEHPDAQQVVRQIVHEMCQALGHDADKRRKQYNEYLLKWHPDKGCTSEHSTDVLKFLSRRKEWFCKD